MARSRNIKPGFFTNDGLAELPFEVRLLFIGLWTLADREGRLEDRPKRIRMEIFPGDNVDVDESLCMLEKAGFIVRYVVDGARYIEVVNFSKHQNPHPREAGSTIPPRQGMDEPPLHEPHIKPPDQGQGGTSVEPRHDQGMTKDVASRADSLHSDSLHSHSMGAAASQPAAAQTAAPPAPKKPKAPPKAPPATGAVWDAYRDAFVRRYGQEPVRNARVNAQLAQLVGRIGAAEAPAVAAFYVGHNGRFYVEKCHGVGYLLADAEKLRTEWARRGQGEPARAAAEPLSEYSDPSSDIFAGAI